MDTALPPRPAPPPHKPQLRPPTAAADDAMALLALVACAGPAEPRRRLLDQHRDPARALAAGSASWRAAGLTPAQVAALTRPDRRRLDAARRWLAQPDHHLLGWHDPDYPPLLRQCASPPLALFVAGDPSLLWRPAVAVVGSRSPTPAGVAHAGTFARALARAGMAIASGLAAGVDTAAHDAALAVGGITVAVLGTGPDVPYPRANTALHARVVASGAVVSEHLPGTGPRREHFPSRNRILAALGLGTLVVEAAWRSGALITARLAAETGREVMALPGSIHNPMARGCHRLIRDGASLVERPEDVLEQIAPSAARLASSLRGALGAPISPDQAPLPLPAPPPSTPGPATTGHASPVEGRHTSDTDDGSDHKMLWSALGHDPTGMDQLVERTGLTAARLSSMLLLMELEGQVAVQHGRYFRTAAR